VEVTAEDAVDILDTLEAAGIDAWLDGGWAVDAVVGEQSRAHKDLDLIVRVSDAAAMLVALAGDEFVFDHGVLDSNFVVRDTRGREIDVHPVRFDSDGNGIYRMENGDDWVFPAEGFQGRGRIAGREVMALTPDVQMLCHATGYMPDETDFADMRLLHTRLGTPLLPPYDETP
jgi:lincosamide nucleotidyltransferase A/C/D/E